MDDIILKKNEQKDIFFINPHQSCQVRFVQNENTSLTLFWFQFASENENFDHIFHIDQQGVNANLNFYGLVCLSNSANVRFKSLVRHQVPDGKSYQLFKYILKDDARGNFDGRVIISPNAQKTEVAQINKNIILTPNAKMSTLPQLEIYADDVKASHGATIGQLDENAIFYMQQRGIDRNTVCRLLLQAFVDEIIQKVDDIDKVSQMNKIVNHFMNTI